MRWIRLTPEERADARIKYLVHWHRVFAWRPLWDPETRIVFWLEYVWERRRARDRDNLPPWKYEYRGGRQAPELKTLTIPIPTVPDRSVNADDY